MLSILSNQIKTIFLLCLTLLSVTGCNSSGIINLQTGNMFAKHSWKTGQREFTLPFTWYDGHIIIELTINEQDKLKFALDSGASTTVLFETSRTDKIQLDVETQINLQGRQVNVVNDASVQLASLEIKGLTIVQVPIDQSPLFKNFDEAYFDGAIGYDLLKHYVTKIDYQKQKITIYSKQKAEDLTNDWQQIPISISGRIPYVAANLKSDKGDISTQQFVIDTGAPDYLYINTKLVDGMTFPSNYFKGKFQNFDGEQTIKTGRLDYFDFAGTQFSNIASHDLPYFEDDFGVGLIGSGLLRKYTIVFDYKNQQMAIKKGQDFSISTKINKSGLDIEPHTKGAVVKHVAPDTGAKNLGLTSGDIITHINNQQITPTNFDLLRMHFSSKQTHIPICWVTKKATRCGSLRLSSQI